MPVPDIVDEGQATYSTGICVPSFLQKNLIVHADGHIAIACEMYWAFFHRVWRTITSAVMDERVHDRSSNSSGV